MKRSKSCTSSLRNSHTSSRKGDFQSKAAKSGMGTLRIIGGDWRGQKLPVREAEGLRPTSDRVRETVFNWLQFEVPGARCLDLFAGSGALGFESLSRGAQWVTFLELSLNTSQLLQQNQRRLGTQAMEVIQTDAMAWLSVPCKKPYDIVFIDPPFHEALVLDAVQRLMDGGYLHERTWIYLEQEKSLPWPDLGKGWESFREKTTAQVRYGLFRCCPPNQ